MEEGEKDDGWCIQSGGRVFVRPSVASLLPPQGQGEEETPPSFEGEGGGGRKDAPQKVWQRKLSSETKDWILGFCPVMAVASLALTGKKLMGFFFSLALSCWER